MAKGVKMSPEELARTVSAIRNAGSGRNGARNFYADKLSSHIVAIESKNEQLEQEKLDILAGLYLESTQMAARVAEMCDEELDRSGALLGRVRIRAKELSTKPTLSDSSTPSATTITSVHSIEGIETEADEGLRIRLQEDA